MRWKTITICLAVILAAVLVGSVVSAQVGDGFDLRWHVMGGGGAGSPLTGSGFSVYSTLGQTGIGPAGAGSSELCAGFWCGVKVGRYPLYLPLVVRNL